MSKIICNNVKFTSAEQGIVGFSDNKLFAWRYDYSTNELTLRTFVGGVQRVFANSQKREAAMRVVVNFEGIKRELTEVKGQLCLIT